MVSQDNEVNTVTALTANTTSSVSFQFITYFYPKLAGGWKSQRQKVMATFRNINGLVGERERKKLN